MGSVPINMPLLFAVSACIEVVSSFIGIALFIAASDEDGSGFFLLLCLAGFAYFWFIYSKYRNKDARHTYEKETKNEIDNIVRTDEFLKYRTKLTSRYIEGRNDNTIDGD